MYTLDRTPRTRLVCQDLSNLSRTFKASAALPEGTHVKVDANGKLAPLAAATDKPIGVVLVPSRKADDDATILLSCQAIVYATASTAVTRGSLVAYASKDAANVVSYAPAVTGNTVLGIALTDIAAGTMGDIGLIFQPYTL